MIYKLRWQILLAIVALLLIVPLLAIQQPDVVEPTPVVTVVADESGACTAITAARGGIVAEGMIGAPQYPNPLLADANPVDAAIVALIYDGLTRYDNSGLLVPALAESWTVSEDGTRVRFELRSDAFWHDGEPVVAADVAATYAMMQSAEFPGDPGLQSLWQSVQIIVVDPQTIEFVLPQPYSPFMEATTRGIMPAHLLADVSAENLPTASLNTRPVGTGPLRVADGNAWPRDGYLRLQANPDVWDIALDYLDLRFYKDDQALIDAYNNAEIQAMTSVAHEMLPEIAALPGMRLFTSTEPRYAQLLFNVNTFEPQITADRAVREAVAYALDREQLIDAARNGQGIVLDGPYLPSSSAYQPGVTAYATNVISATALLDDAGWVWPSGSARRLKIVDPDSADIPLQLRLLASNSPEHATLAANIMATLRQVGIGVAVETLPADAYFAALAERRFDMALVDVRPPYDPDLYDFWSQEAIVRGQNYAGWNQRRASEALEEGRQLWSSDDRTQRYGAFLQRFDDALPAYTLFQYVTSYGLSDAVDSAEIGLIIQPRDRYNSLPQWTINTQSVAVACPE